MRRPPDRTPAKLLLLALAIAAYFWFAPSSCRSGARQAKVYGLGKPERIEISTSEDTVVLVKCPNVSEATLKVKGSGVPFDPKRDAIRAGSTLVIKPRAAKRWWDFRTWGPIGRQIEVLVPSDLSLKDLSISTVSGSIGIVSEKAEDRLEVSGTARLSTVSGGISVDWLKAPSIDIGSASGPSINIALVAARKADIHSGSGSIEIGRFEGGDLRLDNASGSVALYDADPFFKIDVGTASGAVHLETGDGLAPSIKARSASGSIVIDGTSYRKEAVVEGGPERIEVETASGSVRVETHR